MFVVMAQRYPLVRMSSDFDPTFLDESQHVIVMVDDIGIRQAEERVDGCEHCADHCGFCGRSFWLDIFPYIHKRERRNVRVKGERHKYSFPAVDTAGRIHQVEVWAEVLEAGTLDDPYQEVDGLLRLQTNTGERVIYLGRGRYQITGTGESLTSDDPQAI
jgi:hypothetical protein